MRGLYMVLGSVVTILVLAVVAFEAPKYFRAGANTKTEPISKAPLTTQPVVTTQPPAQTSPQAVDAAVPAAAPDNTAPASQLPSTAAQTPVPAVTRPSSTPQTPPQTRPQTAPQTTAQITPAPPATTQQTAPPVTTTQASPPVATQAVAPPVNRELNEVREQYNELSVRASASKTSLDSITQQMRSQGGLGLRRDIVEAQTRLDYQMKEAMDSIRSGDVNGAREHLQFASGNLQVIDKFLGH
jgi:hypothetical protein